MRTLVAGLLLAIALAAGAARADDPPQIQLGCHANTVFSPKLPPKLRVADIVGPITSSAPGIVYAYPDRAGGGSVGEVTLVAQGKTGDAVVTYGVKNRFNGASATFRLVIHVTCPVPPDGPPPPPPPPPVHDGPSSAWPHPAYASSTACKVCRSIAENLNATIDAYNREVSSGAPAARLQMLLGSIGEARSHLRDCEKLCLKPPSVRDPHPPPQPPPPPAIVSRRWPHPAYAVTDCPSCRSIAENLNATIDEFNRGVSDGSAAPARLEMILKSLDAARAHLADCEKSCHASVVSGSVLRSIGVDAPTLAQPNTNDIPANGTSSGGAGKPP